MLSQPDISVVSVLYHDTSTSATARDLVHEVKAALTTALHVPGPRTRPTPAHPFAPRRAADGDGDLGYDLVHEG